MSSFMQLEQLVDKRQTLITHRHHPVRKRKTNIRQCERGIHHSATRVHLAGSNPEGFANYHVNHLNWPCIGYTFTITPSRVIQTSKGPRAEISLNRNLDDLTYHVGNSNDFSLGICIAGDYRIDTLTDAAILSFVELNQALDIDNIAMGGMRGHNRYPGYSSTACPVFEPDKVLSRGKQLLEDHLSDVYIVKAGDTLYSISKQFDITVQQLISWNRIDDPKLLQIGARIKLTHAALKDENGFIYTEETGRFRNTSGSSIYVRFNGPSIHSQVATMLHAGGTISFDRTYIHGGYKWVSHVYNGIRRFTPIAVANGESVGRLWGEFY